MKLVNLFFVQIAFLIVICLGHNGDRANGALSKNKKHVKTEKDIASSGTIDTQPITLPGKHRRGNFGSRKKQSYKESRIKARSAIINTEEAPVTDDRRKSKAVLRQHDDVEVFNNKKNKCPLKCVMSKCLKVDDSNCAGFITKDQCGCCPICKSSVGNETCKTAKPSTNPFGEDHPSGNACNKLVCPEFTECILNIQGIPVCRCPNVYACQSAPKDRLCSKEGRSYKNKCFLKIEECTRKQKIEIAYGGDCKNMDSGRLSSVYEKESEKNLKKIDPENKKLNRNKSGAFGKTENKLKKHQSQKSSKKHDVEVTSQTFQLERNASKRQDKKGKIKRKKRI